MDNNSLTCKNRINYVCAALMLVTFVISAVSIGFTFQFRQLLDQPFHYSFVYFVVLYISYLLMAVYYTLVNKNKIKIIYYLSFVLRCLVYSFYFFGGFALISHNFFIAVLYLLPLPANILLFISGFGKIKNKIIIIICSICSAVLFTMCFANSFIHFVDMHWTRYAEYYLFEALQFLGEIIFTVCLILFIILRDRRKAQRATHINIPYEQQLITLKNQYEQGHISLDEYTFRKQEILNKI